MSIQIIDTLHSLGNFPVVNSNEVQCGSERLDTVLSSRETELNSKASKTYVDTNFAKKTEIPTVPTKVSAFTNDSGYITSHQDISGKADKTDLNTISNRVYDVETEQSVLNSRIDTIEALPEGSGISEARLEDICTKYDGSTSDSPGNAVREQVSSIVSDINYLNDFRSVTFETAERGKFIGIQNGYPTIVSASGGAFGVSSVIHINKNETIYFKAQGYETNVVMICQCDSSGNLAKSLAKSKSSNTEIYTYTAKNDMYVRLSYFYGNNTEYILKVYGERSNLTLGELMAKNAIISSSNNVLSESFNLNDCEVNKLYLISKKCVNTPDDFSGGILITYGIDADANDTYAQFAIGLNAFVYTRFKTYGGSWTEWKKNVDTSSLSNAFISSGVISSSHTNVLSSTFDLNNCDPNKTYTISTQCVNAPSNGGCVTTIALESTSSDTYYQMFVDISGYMYTRFKRYGGTWTDWRYSDNKSDTVKEYCKLSLFSRVGVIGDSYASGAIFKVDGTLIEENNRISWIQQLARRNGFTGINFSKGGLSTRTWLTDSKGLTKLNSENKCGLYILALGINDWYGLGESYLGTTADMDTEADTFYGNYAKIIRAVKAKGDNVKLVIATIAIENNAASATRTLIEKFNVAIKNLAEKFSIPVADIKSDYYFNSDTYKNQILGGHPTATGYSALATAYENVISKTMIANNRYFEDADFS